MPLTWTEYVKLYPESTEIGRDINDREVVTFHDNGKSVGAWRQNRRTTTGQGEILNDEQAACCREWCKRLKGERAR